MNPKMIHLLVSMPGKVVMDEMVEMVILSTIGGNKGILPGHEPASIALRNGTLRVRRKSKGEMLRVRKEERSEIVLMVMGGYATVRNNTINVITPVADTPERIELVINRILKDREQNIKYEQTVNLEMNRAEMALRNILLRRDESVFSFPKSMFGNNKKD